MRSTNIENEEFEEAELSGKMALFTELRIDMASMPEEGRQGEG